MLCLYVNTESYVMFVCKQRFAKVRQREIDKVHLDNIYIEVSGIYL